MTLLFRCRKCGTQAPSLEGHKCVAAPARLEQARAVLREVEERKEVRPLKTVHEPLSEAPVDSAKRPGPKGFDRNAYHRAYMKAYMRGWRARRKAT